MNKRTEEDILREDAVYDKVHKKVVFLTKCKIFGVYHPDLDPYRRGNRSGAYIKR